ncbi:MAG: Ig-like domain-containing protein [Muribaculaceae bacterium]|nr:Ig-like domain-containing protein [Muribaculaceae bacterium]
MKKLIIILMAVLSVSFATEAKKMSDLKIYINPGHGGYTSNDRPINIYPFANNDTLSFWESKSNLYKGLHMYHILDSLGAKPYLSRIKNTEADDRSLSGIAAEANQLGVDLFFSIHSNAGESVNYPLMLYRENEIGTPRYPENITLSKILWKELYSNQLPYWTRKTEYVCGDLTFYQNMWQGGLGVLRTLYTVGLLSEGGMHEHRPEAYRLMNDDYLWLEAWHFVRAIMEYYNTEDRFSAGNVAGLVYDNHNLRELQIPRSFTAYGRDKLLPLNGADIKLCDKSGKVIQTRTTDNIFNGIFVFRNVAPGEYTVKVSHDSYTAEEYPVTVTANQVSYLDCPLDMIRPEHLEVTECNLNGVTEPVSCASTIDFTFNTDIDEESFRNSFTISPEVDGYIKFSNSYHSAQFIPELSLATSTEYTVTISTGARTASSKNQNGNLAQPYVFKFSTQGRNRLELTETYPSEGGVIHFSSPNVEFRFDRKINGSNFYDLISITDSKGANVAFDTRNSSFNKLANNYGNAVLAVRGDLQVGETYYVKLSGEIRDNENLPMVQDVNFSFKAIDESGVKENSDVAEDFETAALYAGNLDKSEGMTAKPTYTRSTAKKLFGTAAGIFTYKFKANRGGDAFWDYAGSSDAQFYDGDILGMYVNGDFSNHELFVVLAGGTDEKSFSLGKLDFRGWRYLEVELHELLDETPYHIAGMRLLQDDNPVSQNGSFVADNLSLIKAGDSGVASVADDAAGVVVNVENRIITADSVSGVKAIEVIGADGRVILASKSNIIDGSGLTPAVYIIRVTLADATTCISRVVID